MATLLGNKNKDLSSSGEIFSLCSDPATALCRSWHDEAYLYINQAITQEKPSINRPDVALMMYQKGLGLLDLAMCVDIEVCLQNQK